MCGEDGFILSTIRRWEKNGHIVPIVLYSRWMFLRRDIPLLCSIDEENGSFALPPSLFGSFLSTLPPPPRGENCKINRAKWSFHGSHRVSALSAAQEEELGRQTSRWAGSSRLATPESFPYGTLRCKVLHVLSAVGRSRCAVGQNERANRWTKQTACRQYSACGDCS